MAKECKKCQELKKKLAALRRKMKKQKEEFKSTQHYANQCSRAAAREACRPVDMMGRRY